MKINAFFISETANCDSLSLSHALWGKNDWNMLVQYIIDL